MRACGIGRLDGVEKKLFAFDFSHIHGSGFRGLYDLKAPGESKFIIATGQSGNFLSKHYRTFLSRWRDGDYIRIGASSGPPSGTITLSPHE